MEPITLSTFAPPLTLNARERAALEKWSADDRQRYENRVVIFEFRYGNTTAEAEQMAFAQTLPEVIAGRLRDE